MEVVDSVLLGQLIMNFETRLEKIFKQLELFRFPVERGHRCRKGLRQFGNSVNIVMQFCRIVVVCQLLKRQKNLVCLNCSRGVFTAVLWLTCRTVPFLLSRRYTRGPVSDFFVNSCHVVAFPNLFCCSCYHIVAEETLSELLSPCNGRLQGQSFVSSGC